MFPGLPAVILLILRNPVNPVKFSFFFRVHLCLSVVALAGLLVAGCAEMHWSKAGVDAAKLEEDLAQCRGEARLQASRESVPRTPGSPHAIRADAAGRPVVAPPASRGTDSLVLEQDLTSACMRGKGYALAPR
jgi:hypothetical protein